jgi:hypothetical protein
LVLFNVITAKATSTTAKMQRMVFFTELEVLVALDNHRITKAMAGAREVLALRHCDTVWLQANCYTSLVFLLQSESCNPACLDLGWSSSIFGMCLSFLIC